MNLRPVPSWLDVPCPRRGCHADAHEPCREPGGSISETTHGHRERASTNAWLATQGYEPLGVRA